MQTGPCGADASKADCFLLWATCEKAQLWKMFQPDSLEIIKMFMWKNCFIKVYHVHILPEQLSVVSGGSRFKVKVFLFLKHIE